MQTFNITVTGTVPVLFHNAAELVNPFSEVSKAKKALTDKKTNKTDDDKLEIAKLEWKASWYFDAQDGPVLPAASLYASLIRGAALTRNGKNVERGVQPAFVTSPLKYDGPRDLKGLWGAGLGSPFVDFRPVGQQAVKVMRCRPILAAGWSVDTVWNVDESMIDPDLFLDLFRAAGQYQGVGDYRKIYGRYAITV